MKRKLFNMAGVLAVLLVFGLAMAACEEPNPFIGTWTSQGDGGNFVIVFTEGSFTITSPGGSVERGIYSWLPGDTTITMNSDSGMYTASISGNTLTVGNRTYTKS